jgi:hypothetical protein
MQNIVHCVKFHPVPALLASGSAGSRKRLLSLAGASRPVSGCSPREKLRGGCIRGGGHDRGAAYHVATMIQCEGVWILPVAHQLQTCLIHRYLSLQRPYLARKAARHLDSHQPSATYDLSYLHLKRLAQDQGPPPPNGPVPATGNRAPGTSSIEVQSLLLTMRAGGLPYLDRYDCGAAVRRPPSQPTSTCRRRMTTQADIHTV